MSPTLLFIGVDEAVRCDLAFVPGDVLRFETIPQARRHLLRGRPPVGDHLVAYGPDVAAAADDTSGPLGCIWGTPIVLVHGEPAAAVWRGAVALRVRHVVSLPDGWPWLLAALGSAVAA